MTEMFKAPADKQPVRPVRDVASLAHHARIFEDGTVQTKGGQSVSSRVVLDVIGVLNALIENRRAEANNALLALYYKNTGLLDIRETMGSHYELFTDKHILKREYAAVIGDILVAPRKGNDWRVDAAHYSAQFEEKAPRGFTVAETQDRGLPVLESSNVLKILAIPYDRRYTR